MLACSQAAAVAGAVVGLMRIWWVVGAAARCIIVVVVRVGEADERATDSAAQCLIFEARGEMTSARKGREQLVLSMILQCACSGFMCVRELRGRELEKVVFRKVQ